MIRLRIVLLLILLSQQSFAQSLQDPDHKSFWEPAAEFDKARFYGLNGTAFVLYGGLLLGLNEYWYSDFEKSPFHFFNDNKEWNQIDKVGHVWTAYTETMTMTELYSWSGLDRKKAVLWGAGAGFLFQSSIELLDGYNERWGASPGDIIANALGTGMFLSQELIWKEQKFLLKFGLGFKNYEEFDSNIQTRMRSLYGTSIAERILKDYNAQSYWLSFRPKSVGFCTNCPEWLALSVGYSADNLFGGFENEWEDGEVFYSFNHIPRERSLLIGPDVRFQAIKTKKRGVKILLKFLDVFKFPFPSIELNSESGITFNLLTLN